MEKTWKPQAGGILSILGGAIALVASFGILIAIIAVSNNRVWMNDWYSYGEVGVAIPVLWTIGIPLFLCGLIALAGGICAVQRKAWGLALAGSIAAFVPAGIFGLLATIFIAISREEFESGIKPVALPEKTVQL